MIMLGMTGSGRNIYVAERDEEITPVMLLNVNVHDVIDDRTTLDESLRAALSTFGMSYIKGDLEDAITIANRLEIGCGVLILGVLL